MCIEKKLKEHSDKVLVLNASIKHPKAQVAKNFKFYGLESGENLIEDLYFCAKCFYFVVNKRSGGSNPFLRHMDKCVETTIELSQAKFAEVLSDCLNLAGSTQIVTTKDEIMQKIQNLKHHITDKNV